MLIRCPTCASGYDLAPEVLRDGRILRCANCRDAWVHRSEGDGGPAITAQAIASRSGAEGSSPAEAAARRPRWARRPRFGLPRFDLPRPTSWATATFLAAALIGGSLAAVAGKARLVAAYPPSQAVFATLGLPVNLPGLALGDVRSAVTGGDGPATLTLEGRITNLRGGPTPIPALRIAVRDKSRRELYYWSAPAPKAELAAGETVLFRSRLTAPPRDGEELAVSFAEAAPGRRRLAEVMPGDR